MAGIIKRKDYVMFTDNLRKVICFCKNCDPKGEGGHGGIISSYERDDMEFLKKDKNFCPTCGDKINWDDVIERVNYLR